MLFYDCFGHVSQGERQPLLQGKLPQVFVAAGS
jgi:hypothetical protein